MAEHHLADYDGRIRETAALLLVGDGLLGLLNPSAHCRVWRTGHGRWDAAVAWFAERPGLVRACAAAELAAGIWMAERQFANLPVPPGQQPRDDSRA
jgi:hypothetical protein